MKCLIRHGGLWLLLFLAWSPKVLAQFGQEKLTVSRVVLSNIGPQAASDDFIRANIRIKAGDTFDTYLALLKKIDDDVMTLYSTGLFNASLRVTNQITEPGVVMLTYILPAKLRISGITLEGNTNYSTSKLLKKVTSKVGDPVDERKLFEDSMAIETLYEKAGYTHTTARYDLINVDQSAGRAGVVFEIKETPKIKIIDVVFTGAKVFDQKTLRGVIKTRRHWMFSWLTRSGIFKDDQFAEDIDRLREFYQSRGYIDFEIQRTNFTYPTPREMKIDFVISEGGVYQVGNVTLKSNVLFTTEQIIAGLKQQHDYKRSKVEIGPHGLEADVGMIFKPQSLSHDIQAIEDFYGARGYIDVGRGGNLRVRQIPNIQAGTMDIEYLIDEGEKSYIEKIEIKGNIKTRDRVIRRELSVSPGDVFDMVRVQLSKQRIEGLDYFERVEMEPVSEPGLSANRKNLIVTVGEKSTGTFSFGAGFNTVENLSAFVQVEQRNFDLFRPPYFTGAGQKFRLALQLGTQVQNYQLSFEEPWFLNRKLIFGVNLYHSVFDYVSQDNLYNEARTGVRFSLTRALGSDFLIGSVSYGIENVNIMDVNTNAPDAILADAGRTLSSRIGGSLAFDTRREYDNKMATRGQRTAFQTSLTAGDRNYVNLDLSSGWYFKGLAKGHILEIVARGGVAQTLTSADVPFYDRYYLGGLQNLRGYDYRAVGPREVTQNGSAFEPIGGDTYWFGSAEYSIPIISHLRFAVFYDIGNVSEQPWSNDGFEVIGKIQTPLPGPIPGFTSYPAGNTGQYSDNFGFGLHLDIPNLGPLRLDYGIPLHHDQFNSSNGKFQFGVSYNRPL